MTTFLSLLGILAAYVLIRYREIIGDTIGQPDWASKVGGIYNVVIFCGIFVFFWSLATLTGTTDVLFAPLLSFMTQRETF